MDFPRLTGKVTFAFDSEVKDDGLAKDMGPGWCWPDFGYVVGWSLAVADQDWYFPIKHEGGGNLPEAGVRRFIKDALKNTSATCIMMNRTYDEGWARRERIPVRCRVVDVKTAAPLLDEYKRKYSLDAIAAEYLGITKDDRALEEYCKKQNQMLRAEAVRQQPGADNAKWRARYLKERKWHPKEDLWRMPADVVAPYAKLDARLTYDAWFKLVPLLHEQNLWELFLLESSLLPILIEMRWRGIRVATDAVEQAVTRMKREQAVLQRELDVLAGRPVSVWAEADLAGLFRDAGLVPAKTPTGKDSFRADWLKVQDHALARGVLGIRKLDKARGVFLEGYVLNKQVHGRVHGEFHPQKSDDGGAVTGRFSASSPNLQNLPARNKEIKQLVRGAFLPEEGQEWAACDYSQQEPRLTVYYAALTRPALRGARKAAQQYMENPDLDYHQFMADITGMERDRVKPINLGVGYGMGPAKLCRSLGLPTVWIELPSRRNPKKMELVEVAGEEGQAILDQYHENAPFIRGLTKACQARAKQNGFIRTILGRRCRLSDSGYKGDFTYKAMNRLIQGSAADQTKKAMVACWEAGLVPLVAVHDELGFSVGEHREARRIAELMETCLPLRIDQDLYIPSKVDVELGPNWGAAAEKLKSEQEEAEFLALQQEDDE